MTTITENMIGICLGCGNQFLDGALINSYSRLCCANPANIQYVSLDDADHIMALIYTTSTITVSGPIDISHFCGSCETDYPQHVLFNTPFRSDEHLCANCLAKYNRQLLNGQDPRAIFPNHL